MGAKSFCVSASPGFPITMILTVLLVSMHGFSAEESVLISQSSAAPPPNSVEARIKLRQHRDASALNRFTFSGNVLENIGDIVEHWIVMFCPGWHEKCQSLLPSYELLGVQWEDKLNIALMSSKVRFAKVDCATEKSLCVSLGIDDYPSVVHYRQQERVNSWYGGAPGLVRWVKEELQPAKRRASPKGHPPASSHSKLEQALDKAIDQVVKQPAEQTCSVNSASSSPKGTGTFRWYTLYSMLFLAILPVVCYCMWKYTTSRNVRKEPPVNPEVKLNISRGSVQEQGAWSIRL